MCRLYGAIYTSLSNHVICTTTALHSLRPVQRIEIKTTRSSSASGSIKHNYAYVYYGADDGLATLLYLDLIAAFDTIDTGCIHLTEFNTVRDISIWALILI